jgi:hypothetical protein
MFYSTRSQFLNVLKIIQNSLKFIRWNYGIQVEVVFRDKIFLKFVDLFKNDYLFQKKINNNCIWTFIYFSSGMSYLLFVSLNILNLTSRINISYNFNTRFKFFSIDTFTYILHCIVPKVVNKTGRNGKSWVFKWLDNRQTVLFVKFVLWPKLKPEKCMLQDLFLIICQVTRKPYQIWENRKNKIFSFLVYSVLKKCFC